MAYSLYYYDVVKIDLIEAKKWYKKHQPGLEIRFAAEVKDCFKRLQNNPLNYEIKYKNVRTAFTAIFPYAIHFYLDDAKQLIVIIGIIHQSRNPDLSYNRDNDE